MKQSFLLLILLLVLSCGMKSNLTNKTPININHVKKKLCYQNILNVGDTIRCPDRYLLFN